MTTGVFPLGRVDVVSASPASYAKVVVQLVGVPRNILVADHVDDPPVLDDVMAVGEGRGEVEILLDQEDREALLLQPPDQQGFTILLVEQNFQDRKSTRLNSSHLGNSYDVFCL